MIRDGFSLGNVLGPFVFILIIKVPSESLCGQLEHFFLLKKINSCSAFIYGLTLENCQRFTLLTFEEERAVAVCFTQPSSAEEFELLQKNSKGLQSFIRQEIISLMNELIC